MSAADAPGPEQPTAQIVDRRLVLAIALISAGVLGFEIALLRILLIASWHHLAFLVISIALLGFGASGTMLALLRQWFIHRGSGALIGLALASALCMLIGTGLVQKVPIEARIIPALLWHQLGTWMIYWALLLLPFLLGAGAIGLALMISRGGIALVYAGNLVGSGLGVVAITLLMGVLPPAWLPVVAAGLAVAGAACVPVRSRMPKTAAVALCAVAASLWLWLVPPDIRGDPYKYGAYVRRLEAQGTARRIAVRYGARGQIEVYGGRVFHELPFLGPGATPPRLHALLIDGHRAGSVLDIDDPGEAAALDQVLMAFPYALVRPEPRVLLLGERGGANIWLALQNDARWTVVVQPDAGVFELLRASLKGMGGQVMDLEGVRTIAAHPRHFVEHARQPYDLIQLASLEGSAAGSSGMAGLGQDYLMTVEGVAACLKALTPNGVLAVGRGIQSPARDNIKLMAMFAEALRAAGFTEPHRHLVVVRDFLAVCTMVRPTPWTEQQIAQIRRLCQLRQLNPVWFPGIRADEVNQRDRLDGPSGTDVDWYHHAASRLFFSDYQRLIDEWSFDVRPPRDNRPYFLDFFRLKSLGLIRETFGDLWLTRTELAFLFVLAAIGATMVCAAVLTVLPLVFLARRHPWPQWIATAVYFSSIGMGYLVLEIVLLSRLTHVVGDPVLAAATTIATFLVASGLGSAVAHRARAGGGPVLMITVTMLVVSATVLMFVLGPVAKWAGIVPTSVRILISVAVAAPVAFLMGFPMPIGLSRLDRGVAPLLPWAWGLNGFASVVAAPLATAIAMAWGFWQAGAVALACYVLAGLVFSRLPR